MLEARQPPGRAGAQVGGRAGGTLRVPREGLPSRLRRTPPPGVVHAQTKPRHKLLATTEAKNSISEQLEIRVPGELPREASLGEGTQQLPPPPLPRRDSRESSGGQQGGDGRPQWAQSSGCPDCGLSGSQCSVELTQSSSQTIFRMGTLRGPGADLGHSWGWGGKEHPGPRAGWSGRTVGSSVGSVGPAHVCGNCLLGLEHPWAPPAN